MDPQIAWNEMLDALAADDWDQAEYDKYREAFPFITILQAKALKRGRSSE